jgi:hypothetical protein
MKKTLLSIIVIGLSVSMVMAQTYTPSAGSPLANGEVGTGGYIQTINAAIPTTADIDGQIILDQLPAAVASAATLAGIAIGATTSYPMDVTSTTLTVEGLPSGLSDDCNGCVVSGGSARDIVITGTPTEAGDFVVNVASSTVGDVTIEGFTIPFGGTFDPGLGFPIPIPAIPAVLNGNGYTMNVNDPNGIKEANANFSLGVYPNPTDGFSTVDMHSKVSGMATIEIYSITGSLVQTNTNSIRVGANRLMLNLTAVPAGIYMVKVDINGSQALVRMQKK